MKAAAALGAEILRSIPTAHPLGESRPAALGRWRAFGDYELLGVATLMQIWVDADACPIAIKEILFRASKRTGVQLTLVANQFMNAPKSPSIRMIQVPTAFGVADKEILKRCSAGDPVITSDLPLAAEVLEKGGYALSPRGMYSTNDIRARLAMRDFMDTLWASGIDTGGPPALSQSNRQLFASHLEYATGEIVLDGGQRPKADSHQPVEISCSWGASGRGSPISMRHLLSS